MSDYASWAKRRGGKAAASAPPPSAAAAPAGQLPAPPPGYGWVHNPQYGWMAVPIVPTTPAERGPYPAAPPWNPPAHSPAVVHQPQAPVNTCALVKPGGRDTYAELLAGVPDLVPPSGWDAMAGNPDPAVQQELASLPEYHDIGPGAEHGAPTSAYPAGRQLNTKIGDLRGPNS